MQQKTIGRSLHHGASDQRLEIAGFMAIDVVDPMRDGDEYFPMNVICVRSVFILMPLWGRLAQVK